MHHVNISSVSVTSILPSNQDLLALLSSFTQLLHQCSLKLLQLLWTDSQQTADMTDEDPRSGVVLA